MGFSAAVMPPDCASLAFFTVVGILTLGLGFKGFTAKGLPFTRKQNITGPWARVIGAVCIPVGLGIIAFPWILTVLMDYLDHRAP